MMECELIRCVASDDSKPRKRGRPPKSKISGPGPPSPLATPHKSSQTISQINKTPQLQTQGLPPPKNITPTQSSPPKATPTKTVVKALPTVRDHTTDQLGPEGDEYIPREYDEAGEKKVTATGHPLDGREYRCRTFFVPNRGDKLFMLATECARVLGYRDSYLLFNKNRSLYKIIASQAEKDDLIHQEILPYSYRSRQIAIVTAKSMFRQFGSRVIVNGRRVRDDYWEGKARKQGFTEEDLAGEKRPGAAKARDAAAAEAANAGALPLAQLENIIYANGPGHLEGHPQPQPLQPGLGGPPPTSIAPLPMIHLAPQEDFRLRDYGNIPRPRQEITGAPYQDRTQPSATSEILNQAAHTAEFNKAVNQQRAHRGKYLDDFWTKPREIAASTSHQQQSDAVSQSLQSPQLVSSGMMGAGSQPILQHTPSQMMAPQAYSQQQHQPNSLAQSPIRGMPPSIRPDQMHHRSPNLPLSAISGQQSPYNYSQHSQMWGQPPPQPQPSPIATHHNMSQYSPQVQQHSPHPTQSPHHPPPQLHHQQSSPSLHSGSMGYQGIPSMGPGGYPGVGARGLYQPQPGQSSQQFMPQTTAAGQPGMHGWAPPHQQGQPGGSQSWGGY